MRPAIVSALVLSFHCLAVAPAAADTRIRVELDARDCHVTIAGASGKSTVRYPRPTPELRCHVSAGPSTDRTELAVLLPPNSPPPYGAFPQLDWTERDGRWRGTARLPAPPAFVRVPARDADAWQMPRVLDGLLILAAAAGCLWSLRRAREG